ncbi:lithostathine [Rhinolophus sinicus]|uniref:lithostathine n=1 Tax=Rhinolophus sinicus TaxID=89399 RepID=UPI003D78E26B
MKGQDPESKLASPRSSCPAGSYAYRFHCYALFRTPKSWTEADIACQKRPTGNLVSVLSAGEASFLATLVKNNLNIQSNVWIGIHDPTESYVPNAGGWVWSNDDVLDYEAWEKNPCSISNPGYCGSLSPSSGYLKWKDYQCHEKLPYICKFEA